MHKQAIHSNKLAAQKLAAVLISMEHTLSTDAGPRVKYITQLSACAFLHACVTDGNPRAL